VRPVGGQDVTLVAALDDGHRQIRAELFRDADRPRARSAAAVRAAEGFVRVVVHHVRAEIAGPRDAQDGVHVRAVEIDEAAPLVNAPRDFAHLPVEQAQRAGIGDHEHGDRVVQLGRQVLQIDEARGIALHRDEVEARHLGTGRVRAVGAIGREHFSPRLVLVSKIGGRDHERGQLAVRPGRRLQ
jgi:hypothetical protein